MDGVLGAHAAVVAMWWSCRGVRMHSSVCGTWLAECDQMCANGYACVSVYAEGNRLVGVGVSAGGNGLRYTIERAYSMSLWGRTVYYLRVVQRRGQPVHSYPLPSYTPHRYTYTYLLCSVSLCRIHSILRSHTIFFFFIAGCSGRLVRARAPFTSHNHPFVSPAFGAYTHRTFFSLSPCTRRFAVSFFLVGEKFASALYF